MLTTHTPLAADELDHSLVSVGHSLFTVVEVFVVIIIPYNI